MLPVSLSLLGSGIGPGAHLFVGWFDREGWLRSVTFFLCPSVCRSRLGKRFSSRWSSQYSLVCLRTALPPGRRRTGTPTTPVKWSKNARTAPNKFPSKKCVCACLFGRRPEGVASRPLVVRVAELRMLMRWRGGCGPPAAAADRLRSGFNALGGGKNVSIKTGRTF